MTDKGQSLTFEESIVLEEIAKDCFRSRHKPWQWPWAPGAPGSVLLSMAAAAAYRTVPANVAITSLHAQFGANIVTDKPIVYRVQRVRDGGFLTTRKVAIEQDNREAVWFTIGFVQRTRWKGPAMKHSSQQIGHQPLQKVELDEFRHFFGRKGNRPRMEFQRLPLINEADISSSVQPVVGRIIDSLEAPAGSAVHVIGLMSLTDCMFSSAPHALHDVKLVLPPIGDTTSGPQVPDATSLMTLDHTVHIHSHDFRTDELLYFEMDSPWADNGRAFARSRIFKQDGTLIASCSQEALTVFRPDAKLEQSSKL
jgi:acyl-CoA thioesterase